MLFITFRVMSLPPHATWAHYCTCAPIAIKGSHHPAKLLRGSRETGRRETLMACWSAMAKEGCREMGVLPPSKRTRGDNWGELICHCKKVKRHVSEMIS